jgi:hypothetical protein
MDKHYAMFLTDSSIEQLSACEHDCGVLAIDGCRHRPLFAAFACSLAVVPKATRDASLLLIQHAAFPKSYAAIECEIKINRKS